MVVVIVAASGNHPLASSLLICQLTCEKSSSDSLYAIVPVRE